MEERSLTWHRNPCFQLQHKLMGDGRFQLDLLLRNRIRMGRVPDTGPVNGQSRITLLRCIGNGRVHVAVIAIGIAQAEPVHSR